jgi:hypothetical protein
MRWAVLSDHTRLPMYTRFVSLLLAGACLWPAFVFAQVQETGGIDYETAREQRRLQAARTQDPIRLDGRLDEPAWQRAPLASNFVQNDPREGQPATHDTEVRLLYDERAIYIGVFARDPEPGKIIVNELRKDFNTGSADGFQVVIDTFKDERNGYQFAINPAGAKWDAQMSNEGRDNNANWDGIWDVGARIGDDGWYAEIEIPFKTLKFGPEELQTWGINFQRRLRRYNENSYWSPLRRQWSLSRVSVAGSYEGLQGLRPGANIRVKPYGLANFNKVATNDVDPDFDAGFDVKYGVTTGLTWDFTVNTDFSQVEADEQQINLTRFNLFFPEKRDFFLRDVDIFEFGQIGSGGFSNLSGTGSAAISAPARQNARPFFSRKIGLGPNGQTIDIDGGVKLSGRVGDWNLGSLLIRQDETADLDSEDIFVGRTVLNVGSRTQVGAIVTDGNPQGDADNTLVGTDIRYRNTAFRGNTVELSGYYEETDTEGLAKEDNASYGMSFFLPNAQRWQALYQYKRVEENFFPAAGYVNVKDIEDHHATVGYRHFFAPDDFFRSAALILEGYRAENLDDGSVNNQNVGLRLTSFTNTNDSYWTRYVRYKEVLRLPFTIYRSPDGARAITIPAGEYSWGEGFAGMSWGGHRRISGGIQFWSGDYYDGAHFQQNGNFTWRPNEHFALSFNATSNRIELPGGEFTVRLYGSTIQYAFSSTLSWCNLIQYDNISESFGLNSRLHWIPQAGQQGFVVLNWGAIDPDRDNRFDSTFADLSLKFNYTFRF